MYSDFSASPDVQNAILQARKARAAYLAAAFGRLAASLRPRRAVPRSATA